MKILRLLLFLFFLPITLEIHAQEKPIPVIGFAEFEKYLHRQTDTVYVINFWATWCGPCRRELPEFEKIHHDYSDKKVKVLLVSLDFPSMLDKGLKSYIKVNQIKASVILLNEPDANAWIDKVNPAWSGSLPATLMYKGPKQLFYEHELKYSELNSSILSLINL